MGRADREQRRTRRLMGPPKSMHFGVGQKVGYGANPGVAAVGRSFSPAGSGRAGDRRGRGPRTAPGRIRPSGTRAGRPRMPAAASASRSPRQRIHERRRRAVYAALRQGTRQAIRIPNTGAGARYVRSVRTLRASRGPRRSFARAHLVRVARPAAAVGADPAAVAFLSSSATGSLDPEEYPATVDQ